MRNFGAAIICAYSSFAHPALPPLSLHEQHLACAGCSIATHVLELLGADSSTCACATAAACPDVLKHFCFVRCSRHGKGQHAAPPFEGDVSEWGKTQLESFYDAESDMGPEVSEISSGISPRDMRPRLKPFDMDEAKQVCSSW